MISNVLVALTRFVYIFNMLPLVKAQVVLEQNEDFIASIVENMQLGRIDDCITQFSLLVNQLIPLSLELDNYPVPGDSAGFKETSSQFSDRLMRKDILDDMRNHEDIYIPPPPPPPVCHSCYLNNVS